MLSIIIPSRNIPTWPFLQKTVTDLFNKAVGDVEVIVVLDGFLPDPPLEVQSNLTIIHHLNSLGMRNSINEGVSIAKGDFIMKCDDHVLFGQGYDKILANDCDQNWLVIPARYSLDGKNWLKDGTDDECRKYGPIHYLFLTYPFLNDDQFSWGFHGKKWHGEHGFTGGYFDREKRRKNIPIDDVLSIQGSCWFMPRKLFHDLNCMQVEGYGDYQEAQELTFKVFLSSGRCVVNKNVWYAHLHKGSQYGRGYSSVSYNEKRRCEIYSTDFWMNNRWPKQTRLLKSYIEHSNWWPLETWPEDWDNPVRFKDYDYSRWLR